MLKLRTSLYGLALAFAPGLALADPAVPGDGLPYILESVDLTGIVTTVATMGVIVVAVALTFKGIKLAKKLANAL